MKKRPVGVTILAVLMIVGGVWASLTFPLTEVAFAACSAVMSGDILHSSLGCMLFAPIMLALTIFFIPVGIGLWLLKRWAWELSMLAVVVLVAMGVFLLVAMGVVVLEAMGVLTIGMGRGLVSKDVYYLGLGLAYLIIGGIIWYLLRRDDTKAVFGLSQESKPPNPSD